MIVDNAGRPFGSKTVLVVLYAVIIITEICKAPTMRLKVLNKHNKTHILYIKMENVISNSTKS